MVSPLCLGGNFWRRLLRSSSLSSVVDEVNLMVVVAVLQPGCPARGPRGGDLVHPRM